MSHLSIIVPTLGRPSLTRTLESLLPQLEPHDEVIVVTDGAGPYNLVRGMLPLAAAPKPWEWIMAPPNLIGQRGYVIHGPQTGSWGNAQRDKGMEIATGTHLLFIDDDDAYTPDALEHVRAAIAAAPELAHIFRIRFGPGHPAGPLGAQLGPIWEDQSLRSSNVATPMVVLPNRPDLPRWADGDGAEQLSDFVFIRRAVSRVGGAAWHQPVIATVRP